MHLADALTGRSRYPARLITGDHQQPRLFGFPRGSVATLCVFGGARERFAARLFARDFETPLLGGACRLHARFFSGSLAGDFEAALLFGLAGGSLLGGLLGRLFARRLAGSFKALGLLGSASGRFAACLFPRGLARRFETALVLDGARGCFATRFFTCGLAGGLANGLKATRLFGVASRGIARSAVSDYRVASRLIAPALALPRIATIPFAARAIPVATGPAVAVAPVRFAFGFASRFAMGRALVALAAPVLAVRTAFVFDRSDIALAARGRRLRFGRRRTHRTPVRSVVAALSDHPVEPLVDRHVDALRHVALGLARLWAQASQIPRTARFHPRAQTTVEGAVCAPLSGHR